MLVAYYGNIISACFMLDLSSRSILLIIFDSASGATPGTTGPRRILLCAVNRYVLSVYLDHIKTLLRSIFNLNFSTAPTRPKFIISTYRQSCKVSLLRLNHNTGPLLYGISLRRAV